MRGWAALLVLTLAASTPAQAHHSLIGYDQAKVVRLTGVVFGFHFTQPHPFLIIESQEPGATGRWRLEMDNLHELTDIGLSRDSFKRGEKVLVSGNPDRHGAREMYLRRLDRPSDNLRYEQVGFRPSVGVIPKP